MNDMVDETVMEVVNGVAVDATTHRPEFLVQIVYKSGYIYTGLFEKLETKTTGGKITEISWTLAPSNPHKVIHMGMDDIESIFQLEGRIVPVEAQ